jgi:hypothetical protein
MSRKPNELSSIMAVITRYRSAGYEMFPLHGKKPVHRGWRERDYSDFDAAHWLEQGENIGIRLRAHDLIIDCDPRNYQPGDDPLRRLAEAVSAPLRDAPATITGSGGRHLFFRKPPDLRIVGKLTGYDGLDILTEGKFIVAPGSIHPQTFLEYTADGDIQAVRIAPDALLELLTRPERAERRAAPGVIDPEELAVLLKALDPRDYGQGKYAEWIALSAACHDATNGHGHVEWLEWCAQDPDYDNVPAIERAECTWESFEAGRKGGTTYRTLFRAVRLAGRADLVAPLEARIDGLNGPTEGIPIMEAFADDQSTCGSGKIQDGGDLPEAPTPQQRIAQLAAQYTIVKFAGKVRIMTWERSPVHTNAVIPVFYSKHELTTFFENEFVTLTDASGNSRRVPLFKYWMQQASTPRASGLTLDPAGGRFVDGQLNLWCGFGKSPKAGAWPLLRAHIEAVICNDQTPSSDYLLKWLAWTLQHPAEPVEVAIVLRGLKGTGKGILARVLLGIFATHGLHISSREHLTGRFNAHLLHCCFIFLDEAIWPGDKPGEGTLKRIVTEPTLTIEAKGFDAGEATNRLSIMMSSNEDWVCPASSDERRFAVFNVSDARRKDRAYFDALVEEIDTGGAEAFFADMLAMELGDWHPRNDVPETEGLAMQKQESARPELEWLWNVLEEGALPETISGYTGMPIASNELHVVRLHALWQNCKHSDQRLRYGFSKVKFGRFLATYGVKKVRAASGMLMYFPPILEIRAKFMELNPWMEPFTPGTDKWIKQYLC